VRREGCKLQVVYEVFGGLFRPTSCGGIKTFIVQCFRYLRTNLVLPVPGGPLMRNGTGD
jgi:hypothetical protein